MSRFARVLLLSADVETGACLAEALATGGYAVVWRTTAEAALVAACPSPDLALIDLAQHPADGLSMCRELRGTSPECVIVLLAQGGQEADVVLGFAAGADDYVTGVVGRRALLARVEAHLRRHQPAERTRWGELELDVAARRCRVRNVDVPLRAKEFALLARLARVAGSVVPRTALMNDVWETSWLGSTKTVDVHLAALSKRLADTARRAEATSAHPVLMPSIATVRGVGYRFDPPDADQTRDAYTTRLSS